MAYDQMGELYVSDSRLGLPEKLWAVVGATGLLDRPQDIEAHITDLASEPIGYCQYLPTPQPPVLTEHGDAPDSTNHFGQSMTAYGGVEAQFPTVFDANTGLPQGPRHNGASGAILGSGTSDEFDADLAVTGDPDVEANIDPSLDLADRDHHDDALVAVISLPHCQLTTADIEVTVIDSEEPQYLTLWLDFNRDGDWADTLSCIDPGTGQPQTVSERAAHNFSFSLPAGLHTVTTAPFRAYDPVPGNAIWLRATITNYPTTSTDGRGPRFGYGTGETEDYLLEHTAGTSYAP